MTLSEILNEEVKSEDISQLIKNYLEVYGYHETLKEFEKKDEDSFKSFLVNKKDFKTENIYGKEQDDVVRKPSRKFTEDLLGLELSRLESIDFWTPDLNRRKSSTYSNSGLDRLQRSLSEHCSDLVTRRYSKRRLLTESHQGEDPARNAGRNCAAVSDRAEAAHRSVSGDRTAGGDAKAGGEHQD